MGERGGATVTASTVYELVGYAASLLIIVGIMMRSILRLRLLGLAGSLAFLVYGVLIGSIPLVITNVVIAVIHLWFLRELLFAEEYFTVLRVKKDSAYLRYFCEFHAEEIGRFMPGWAYEPSDDQVAAFILRDMVPAGLFIGVGHGEEIEVKLDFVIPRYRDLEVGRFLYSSRSGLFDDPAWCRAWTRADTDTHRAYVKRMGFVEESAGRWVLDLEEARNPS
jgi:hypothetical protein